MNTSFGSTDPGRPLVVPPSDLLKTEGHERDIGLLGQPQPGALERKWYGTCGCLWGEPFLWGSNDGSRKQVTLASVLWHWCRWDKIVMLTLEWVHTYVLSLPGSFFFFFFFPLLVNMMCSLYSEVQILLSSTPTQHYKCLKTVQYNHSSKVT